MKTIYIILSNYTPIRAFFDRNLAETFLKDIESCNPQEWLHLEECPLGFDLTLEESYSKLEETKEYSETLSSEDDNSDVPNTSVSPVCIPTPTKEKLPAELEVEYKNIYERICKSMEHILETPWDTLEPNNNFVEDLGIDSMDRFEIVMAVEDEFNLELLDSDLDNVNTIQDLVYVVSSKLDKGK